MISKLENYINNNLIDDGIYYVIPFLDSQTHFAGINNKKELALLINNTNKDKSELTNYKGKNLQILYDKSCEIYEDSGESKNKYTVLHLISDEINVKKYFIEISKIIINRIGENPTIKLVENELSSVKNIFLNLSKKKIKEELGLWGELFFISIQDNKEKAISSWHINSKDRIDFNSGETKIEIKTTLSSERKHVFKLKQLRNHYVENVLICSIMTNHIENGMSIKDLVDKISQKINDEIKIKLFEKIFSVLGNEMSTMNYKYFDEKTAKESLKIYKATQIPSIEYDMISDEISNVEFTSNLTKSVPYEKNKDLII